MENEARSISHFFTSYQQTAFKKDVAGMINLYDENVTLFDMWGKGFVVGLKEWSVNITAWLTSLKDERVRVGFEMIEVNEGGDIGFASAIVQFEAIGPDDNVQRSMKNRMTLGFVKTKGVWKVRHQHTSAPIDSDLKAILDIA
jgi:ketosteroid isomerase-like protein